MLCRKKPYQIGYIICHRYIICHIYLPSFLFGLNVLTVIFWPSVGSTCHSSMLSALFMFLIKSRTSSVMFVSLDAPSTMELRLEAMPLTHKQAGSINIALFPGLTKSALQKMALWLGQAALEELIKNSRRKTEFSRFLPNLTFLSDVSFLLQSYKQLETYQAMLW